MATEAYDEPAVRAEAGRGVAVGRLTRFADDGQPIVDCSDGPLVARSIIPLDALAIGRDVALLFEGGDPHLPIVIGVLQQTRSLPVEIEADGERVVLTGTHEVVLRCGKASIQLLSDGTIRLRGTNVLSRASATNRIRGGNVQIN